MKDDYANGFDDGYDAGGEDERINREEQLKELENQNEDGTDSSEDESETIISTGKSFFCPYTLYCNCTDAKTSAADAMDLDTSNDIDAAPINTPIGPSVTNVAPTIPDTTHAASVRQVPGRIYGSRISKYAQPSKSTPSLTIYQSVRSHTRRTFVGNYKGWCQNCEPEPPSQRAIIKGNHS